VVGLQNSEEKFSCAYQDTPRNRFQCYSTFKPWHRGESGFTGYGSESYGSLIFDGVGHCPSCTQYYCKILYIRLSSELQYRIIYYLINICCWCCCYFYSASA